MTPKEIAIRMDLLWDMIKVVTDGIVDLQQQLEEMNSEKFSLIDELKYLGEQLEKSVPR